MKKNWTTFFKKKYPFRLMTAGTEFKPKDTIKVGSSGFTYIVIGKRKEGKLNTYYIIQNKRFWLFKFYWIRFLMLIKYY